MTELFVLLGAAAGIAALVGLNVLLGGWTPARVLDADAAAARLADEFYAFNPGEVALGADGQAALAAERGGPRLGVVIARGDVLVTRLWRPGDVRAVARRGSGRLRILIRDITLPAVTIKFETDAAAQSWAARLERLAQESEGDA